MTRQAFPRVALVLLLFGTIAVSGCGGASRTPRFYKLSSLAAPGGSGPIPSDLAIGVGHIGLPEYLDRPQIVTRVGENELEMSEFHRWAEPLKEDFSRTLAENLGALLGTEKVFVLPWSRVISLDYRVAVSVIRFEGRPGGDVELTARWALLLGEEKRPVNLKKSFIRESTNGSTYEDLVAAHSRALAKLSREVADSVKEQQR